MFHYTQNERVSPVDFRIGNTIRMLRIVRGLSQQALASRLNVTFQQVQKYEKAKTHIASSRLYEIARVLDTPVEVFFDSQGMDRDGQTAIRDMVDRYDRLSPQFGYHEFVELNRAFVGIPDPAVREAILNLVTEIAPDAADGREAQADCDGWRVASRSTGIFSADRPEDLRPDSASAMRRDPAPEAEPA